MKNIIIFIILALMVSLSSCTFEKINNPDDGEEGPNDIPEGLEINEINMSGIWKIDYYEVGLFKFNPSNAPLQYIRLTDSLKNNSNKDFRGNLIFYADSTNFLENDFTFWRTEGVNELRFENEFDSTEVYTYKIERLTNSELVLSETDSDDVLGIFKKSNMTYSELQEFIADYNANLGN
jgi:regulatory protein YycI of two-component signal transduction system YycFG